MILEIMQRNYLASISGELTRALQTFRAQASHDSARRALLDAQQVEFDELDEAIASMRRAAQTIANDENAADETPAFLSRDPLVSQLQSLLQRYYLEHGLTQTATGAGARAVSHPVTDMSLAEAVAMRPVDQLFGQMQQTDIGWLACLGSKAFTSLRKRRKFPDEPAPPCRIAGNARVYLVGDWGSGVTRARKIAKRIRTMLTEDVAREQHVVHLGDVYYSGWPKEYDDHFLQYWPVEPGEEHRYGSWALNANHDMFSGGAGYFDHLLKDARFAGHGGSSFFSLENDHWQVLGLDSAFDDGTLAGSQFDWVNSRQHVQPDKKLVLLTHHQPFSAFEQEYIKLQRLMLNNQVTGWFWGHEHRMAIYEPTPYLPFGRLVGHGGVPVWARSGTAPTPEGVAYVSNRGFANNLERFALFGFAVLDFDGPALAVRYIDEHGQTEWKEVLS